GARKSLKDELTNFNVDRTLIADITPSKYNKSVASSTVTKSPQQKIVVVRTTEKNVQSTMSQFNFHAHTSSAAIIEEAGQEKMAIHHIAHEDSMRDQIECFLAYSASQKE